MTEIQFRFRPLRWAGPSTPADQRRSRATFRALYSQTLTLLGQELFYLAAEDIVIEADFREQDIRRDGLPRGNARQPLHPGVRLFFGSMHGPLMYATDAYEWWQHNLRGIALGLEALRAVDRYGVTRRGEQYTGWKALGNEPAPRTYDQALQFLFEASRATAQERADAAREDVAGGRRRRGGRPLPAGGPGGPPGHRGQHRRLPGTGPGDGRAEGWSRCLN